jgi:hypothetical protein
LASPITSSEENNITRRGILRSGNLVVFIQKRPEEFLKLIVFLQKMMHEISVFFRDKCLIPAGKLASYMSLKIQSYYSLNVTPCGGILRGDLCTE